MRLAHSLLALMVYSVLYSDASENYVFSLLLMIGNLEKMGSVILVGFRLGSGCKRKNIILT